MSAADITKPEVAGYMDNVVLFPKTLDYYEQELTRCLQTEQYGEAQKLISFLLRFHHLDKRQTEQWEALRHWLAAMFPENDLASNDPEDEDTIGDEGQLYRQYVEDRSSYEAGYPDKLLDLLLHGSMEQQMIALEQLGYVDHPAVSETLKSWITNEAQHPHIQFKTIQALKLRGETGYLSIPRLGKSMTIDIEDTPLTPDQYPSAVGEVPRRVSELSETDSPDFQYFAKQTWDDFIIYVYGTPIYYSVLKEDTGNIDLWASALHSVMKQILFGEGDHAESRELYGVTENMRSDWEYAFAAIQKFTNAVISIQE